MYCILIFILTAKMTRRHQRNIDDCATQSHSEFVRNQHLFGGFGINCWSKGCLCASSFDAGGFQLLTLTLTTTTLTRTITTLTLNRFSAKSNNQWKESPSNQSEAKKAVLAPTILWKKDLREHFPWASDIAVEGFERELKTPCVEWRRTRSPFASAVNAKSPWAGVGFWQTRSETALDCEATISYFKMRWTQTDTYSTKPCCLYSTFSLFTLTLVYQQVGVG